MTLLRPSPLSPAGLCCLALCWLCPPTVFAHRVSAVTLVSKLDTQGRTYRLEATMEVVPSEEAALNEQISPEDAAREFAGYLSVMFDEQEQSPKMTVSLQSSSDEATPEELRRQQVVTTFEGTMPTGAKQFLLYVDPRCPMAVVMVAIKDDQPNQRMQVVLAGEYSRPINVIPLADGNPFDAGSRAGGGTGEKTAPPLPRETKTVEAGRAPFVQGWLAFFHETSLPAALVLGMLLLTLGRGSVFVQTALLLIPQGLLLALACWSMLPTVPGAKCGLAILAAVVAVEAVFHHRVRWWRYPLLVLAGLALGAFLPTGPQFQQFVAEDVRTPGNVSLFLLGTESAFVVFTLVCAAVLLPLSRYPWYRSSLAAPLAVLIGGYSVFVAIEDYL